mgnify:CR=1 FL=1
MPENDRVNVLLVDDQPAKLLTYEEILKGLDATLVKASSAREAFQFLLHNDAAVILVDVYMPDLDGFQLASMIRGHPRFEKTPIIFISAIRLSELDRLRGYESGAVDYIPVPVIPAILRAKVKVFVELYRKTLELERLNLELEDRVAERTQELDSSNKRLKESEERLRLASEAAEFGTYDCNPCAGSFHCSAQMKQLLGCESEGELSIEAFLSLVYEPDRAAVRRSIFAKRLGSDRHRVEFRVLCEGGIRWLLGCGQAFYRAGEEEMPARVMGTVLDITERKQVEERQLLLMAELDHRVKNILANVGAIAKLSSNSATSVNEFVSALDARIQAISKAHSMLRRDSWRGINLRKYLSELLAPFIMRREKNIILTGEEIDLLPKAAQSLALVFHELATNSAKYGSLSVPGGKVILSWEGVEGQEGTIKLMWREQGGPAAAEPRRSGFGTQVVKAAAIELGAEVSYSFMPEGVVFSIEGKIERKSKIRPSAAPAPAPAASAGDSKGIDRSLRILLVEDELFVGLQAKTELENAGHEVVALATNLKEGIGLAESLEFDLALLDIRLGDEVSVPIAEKLCERKLPFAFVTGIEDEAVLPPHVRSAPRFGKPYEISSILDALAGLTANAAAKVA